MPAAPSFPEPHAVIAGRNYWSRGQLRQHQAALAGEPEPEPLPDDNDLVGSREVRRMFGGVSLMTLWRWRQPAAAQS